MGRRATGFKVEWRNGIGYARFTHDSIRYDKSTGERDPRAAHEKAAKYYADIVSGRWRPVGRRVLGPRQPLVDLTPLWLEDFEKDHAKKTAETYGGYAAGFIAFFKDFDRITTESAADYVRMRLGKVIRDSVKKELSALRSFISWCVDRGVTTEEHAPVIRPVRRGAVGTHAGKQRRVAVELSPVEVERFIEKLPVTSRGKFAIRARFIVAYETGLRPATLDKLMVPDHYKRGRDHLWLDPGIDKARFGREVPLSPRARAALDEACPDVGLIFGRHDYRSEWRKAAKAAGLPKTTAPYDLRHARATHLLEMTGNLPGTQYLLGHKHVSTTAKYIRASKRAAADALKAAQPRRRATKKGR